MSTQHHLLLLFSCALHLHAGDTWHIGSSTAWTIEGRIIGSKDVSGAASLQAGRGVLVSDESRVAQPFRLDLSTHHITLEDPVTLLPGKGSELDLEAITASPSSSCYYAVGSHAVARKSGKVQPDRLHLFRLPVDAATGIIHRESIAVATLLPVLQSDAQLHNAIGKSADLGGIDIEGLAEKHGTLYIGLRSPSLSDNACIIEVQAAGLFANAETANAETATHRSHQLALGHGIGIRDIAALREGFILIAGRSGDEESVRAFTLYHWAGPGGALARIGDLPSATGKAEGLMVLHETDTAVDVLVLFDGAENGAPTQFQIMKP
jgi:hypothetical protein